MLMIIKKLSNLYSHMWSVGRAAREGAASVDAQGPAVQVLGAAARHPENLNRVELQGRKTQSQREVGVGVLPIVPGSVATLGSN